MRGLKIAGFIRSRAGRAYLVFVLVSAAIAAGVGYQSFRSSVSHFIDDATEDAALPFALINAMEAHNATKPETNWRGHLIDLYNKSQDRYRELTIRWVGLPDRAVETAPTEKGVLDMVLEASRGPAQRPLVRIHGEGPGAVLRVAYPVVARDESCVACHNRLQPDKPRWRLGDAMGAFFYEDPIGGLLSRASLDAVVVGLSVFGGCAGLGLYVFLLQFRKAIAEIDSATRAQRERDSLNALKAAEAVSRSKSEFLAMMSHELRTPLNAIIGFSQMMEAQALGKLGHARYVEYVSDIRNSGQHLLKIMGDVLDMAKVESGALQLRSDEIDLSEAISEWAQTLSPLASDAGVEVKVDIAPGLKVRVDRPRLRQAVVNLITNALKFTPAGGKVRISAKRAFDTLGGITITVVDTGIGMSREDIKTALSPFGQVERQSNRKVGGIGLGLPLAKSFIEAQGGMVVIESELGRGTTVTIRLPQSRVVTRPEHASAA